MMKTSRFWNYSQTIIFIVLALAIFPGAAAQPALAQAGPPLLFVENVGQFPAGPGREELRFHVAGGDAALFFTDQAIWLAATPPAAAETTAAGELAGSETAEDAQPGVAIKLTFLDANPDVRLEPFDRLDARLSYFTGHDPTRWRSDAPVWGGVRYVELYPGLDLEVSGENGQVALRLVVKDEAAIAAGTSADAIRWQVEGADSLSLDDGRQLRLATAIGPISLPLPQTVDGNGAPLELAVSPEINGLEIVNPFTAAGAEPAASSELSFEIAASSDLLFSTFLGGSSSEDGHGLAVDSAGNIYVTGRTGSANFPATPGAFAPELTSIFDIYVAQLSPDGASLEYATFLGGTDSEFPYDLAVAETGEVYIAGTTSSADFPVTPGAYDTSLADSSDVFVVKLSAGGAALEYSTTWAAAASTRATGWPSTGRAASMSPA